MPIVAYVGAQIHADVVAATTKSTVACGGTEAEVTAHKVKHIFDAAAAHRVGPLLVEQLARERHSFGSAEE